MNKLFGEKLFFLGFFLQFVFKLITKFKDFINPDSYLEKSLQKQSEYIQFLFKKRFEFDKKRGLFLVKCHTFTHAVTTQTRVNTSARLEQGGLIPSNLVQIDKEKTLLRKASYEIRTKHVELVTMIYF